MKFTVVTPSFNQGKYLRRCIDSIRTQAYRPVEHIIVDNCSRDETSQVLAEYEKGPNGVEVRFIVEPDKGQADAINKGFLHASGDAVSWLNADEWYLPNAFTRVKDFLCENSEIDIFFGDCRFLQANTGMVKHKREFGYDPRMLLYYGCYLPSCATFLRRRIVDEGLLVDPNLRVCMDFEFYLRLAHKGKKFLHISEELACFLWHTDNISRTLHVRRKEEKRSIQLKYVGSMGDRATTTAFLELMKWFYVIKRQWLKIFCELRNVL